MTKDTAMTQRLRQDGARELDGMARRLAATGDFKVLRRLVPRPLSKPPADGSHKTGIVLDVETTGLDFTKDEIIELAMVSFRYCLQDGAITGVSDIFQGFQQPSIPIPAEITKLTGITDAMVAGQKIEGLAVETFVAGADIIIAHQCAFDRKFVERPFSIFFAHKPWTCSASELDWKRYGFSGAKLSYLIAETGYFHAAHRAIDDCHAVLELLAAPLPGTSRPALGVLLERARRKTYRIWAERSLYDLKDILKRRGYRWNDGADGSLRSWYIDVDEGARDAEMKFLKTEIFQRDADIRCEEFTARERFSTRNGLRWPRSALPRKTVAVR
jgi:DNA polymerase-3 subunit epsilon